MLFERQDGSRLARSADTSFRITCRVASDALFLPKSTNMGLPAHVSTGDKYNFEEDLERSQGQSIGLQGSNNIWVIAVLISPSSLRPRRSEDSDKGDLYLSTLYAMLLRLSRPLGITLVQGGPWLQLGRQGGSGSS